MNQKNIILVLVAVIIILLGVIGFLGFQILSDNAQSNNTTNITIIQNTTDNASNKTKSISNATPAYKISSAEAKTIASEYLDSSDDWSNVAAGTPSLKGGIYYVPMVVTNNEGQHSKGTVIGYVKVDAETGQVWGIQDIYIY